MQENTWESEDNLFCDDLVKAYWDKLEPSTPIDVEEKPIGLKNTRTPTMPPKSPKKSPKKSPTKSPKLKRASKDKYELLDWENLVDHVDGMDVKQGELLITLKWKDGELTTEPNKVANLRCPQKIIAFYEKHLKFTPQEDESQGE